MLYILSVYLSAGIVIETFSFLINTILRIDNALNSLMLEIWHFNLLELHILEEAYFLFEKGTIELAKSLSIF